MNGKWRYALFATAALLLAAGHANAAPANKPQLLHLFCSRAGDACSPVGRMVLGPDGALYGATSFGGPRDGGTVFRVDPSTFSVSFLYSFDLNIQGAGPDYLALGSDGNLYGVLTNSYLNPKPNPSFFRLSLTGEYTPLYTLNGSFRSQPVEDSQGNWYGIASAINPGSHRNYVIYEIAASGTYKILYAAFDGAHPDSLVVAQDGNLYGTTQYGGSYDEGSLFRLSPDGTYTELHSFNENMDDASYPAPDNLIVGSDGMLYGSAGSIHYESSLPVKAFRATLDGQITILHDLPGNGLHFAYSALTLMPDGDYYGTLASALAMIFRVSPAGDVTYLYRFPPGPESKAVPSPLVLGSDNALYGTTQGGGKNGTDMLYRYVPPPVQ